MNLPDFELKREEMEQLVVQLIIDRVLVRIAYFVDHESSITCDYAFNLTA